MQPRIDSGLCICSVCSCHSWQPCASGSAGVSASSDCSCFCLSFKVKNGGEFSWPTHCEGWGVLGFLKTHCGGRFWTLCLLFLTRFLPPPLSCFPPSSPFFIFSFPLASCMWPRLASNSVFSRSCLLSAGITVLYCAQPQLCFRLHPSLIYKAWKWHHDRKD